MRDILSRPGETAAQPLLPKEAVHRLFERAARRFPDHVAIESRGVRTSFRELEERANGLAWLLRDGGAAPGAFVGILAEDVLAVTTALLGSLKAGCAFVPFDPRTPGDRFRDMLAEVDPAWLVTEEPFLGRLSAAWGAGRPALRVVVVAGACRFAPDSGFPALDLHAAADWRAAEPCPMPADPDARCYVYFTSGSTGRPKGIVGRLKGIDHFVRWEVETLGLDEGVRVSQLATPAFDAFLRDVFVPLAVGGTICVPDSRDAILDAPRLVDWLDGERIEVVHCVPTLFRSILAQNPGAERFPALRYVLLAGERLLPADVARWSDCFGDRVQLVNLYGPSETTMTKFCYFVRPSDKDLRTIPIGRPIRGAEAVVLDARGRPCPPGAVGEICIRTPFRSHGYLNRPELEREVFIPNPLTGDADDLLYRTGDFGRLMKDGNFEYLGRRDQQVKIRGVRVELAEVEDVLRRHPEVHDLAVVDREDVEGNAFLCAYVVGGAAATELRELCARSLPESMIPSVFVPMEALPRTLSGKIDRRSLPVPAEVLSASRRSFMAPRTAMEKALADIWGEVLRLSDIGIHDNFFELGGHSLLATRVLTRVRAAFELVVPLRVLFQHPTVASLAEVVRQTLGSSGRGAAPPIERVPRDVEHPASFAQERLWFLQRLEPGSAAYNMAALVCLSGALDIAVLKECLAQVVHRHEALRTTFPDCDGRPVQRIAEPGRALLPQIDLSAVPAGLAEREAQRLVREEARRPFDLAQDSLMRTALLRCSLREHALLVVTHHIVSDLWSMEILTREIAALYEAFVAGRPAALPELPVQFVDFAVWQRTWLRGEVLASELAYWRVRLEDADALQLPTDRPRPALRSARGAQRSFRFPEPLVQELVALGRGEGATLFMILLGAFQVLLARYAGAHAVSVGSPVAGRDRLETEGLVGFFVNTLVLRTSFDGDPGFREALQRVRTGVLEAYAHQVLPLELLMDEIRPDRELSQTPLFQVWLSFQDRAREPVHVSGLNFDVQGIDNGTAKFDLALFLSLQPDGLAATLEYDRDLFDAATIERMAGHLEVLLGGALQEPDRRLSEMPLLAPLERRQLLAEWNRSDVSFPEGRRLHEIFQLQVARSPSTTAVVCDVESLTYAELNARANRLARRLRALGAGPDVPVGLLAERSLDLVVSIVGILKSGGAYVPLDPGHPRERLAHALTDSGARLVVAQPLLFTALAEVQGLTVVDPADPALDGLCGDDPPPEEGDLAQTLAYVIYTSGSTGVPKGTLVTHAHVTRLFAATAAWYRFGPHDVWSLFHSSAFDFSVWELWGALLYGGRLVVVSHSGSRSSAAFYRLLAQEEVTVLSQTPSAFRQLVQADEDAGEELRRGLRLRWVVFGGETLEIAILRSWWERHPEDRPRLVNMYGITETTVHCTYRPLSPADLAVPHRSPIGVPIPDLQVYVLDGGGQPAPVGVPGEIHVGGAGVARGYLGRPELTAARFVPDALSGRTGARLYRSGDLGRWLASGDLEYLGRIDRQVKIRGFRIELGEIEARLAAHPAVREAVVLALPDPEGSLRLVVYAVLRAGAAPTLSELREALAARLPDYMLPSGLVALETLPLTSNGKVDRRALERIEPSVAAPGEAAGAEPATPLEELLAGLWADILAASRVSRYDDFFALGGHSLLATRVVSRIRRALGVEVPLLALFEAPTLEGFARRVEEALALRPGALAPPIVPVDRTGRLPLSFAQQRLWFLQRLEPGNIAYNLPLVVGMKGRLETAALARSLEEVARRHEILRTGFHEEDGRAWQRVVPDAAVPLPVIDLCSLPELCRGAEIRRLIGEEAGRPFDLARPPLMRACLLRGGDDEHLAVVLLHHIVSDEWSYGVLLTEIAALYRAFRDGRLSPLPELRVQYGDFAVWQRRWLEGPAAEDLVAYWRSRLAGVPPLDLPFDRPRPAIQTFRGASRSLPLPEDLDAPLRALARRQEATPFMVLLAAFRALLGRYSNQDDIAIGTPIANRNRAEIEPLIGFFVNTLVLRAGLEGDPSLSELIGRERRRALEAYAHQDLPFERLVEVLQPQRDLSRTPLFQVMLVLHNAPLPALELPGVTLAPVGVDTGTAKLDLTLFAGLRDGRWEATLEANSDLFDAATIDRLGRHFRALLAAVLADPERPLVELDLLAPVERQQLLEWSGAGSLPTAPPLVHHAFEERARRQPGQMAVECSNEALTFAGLNRRANRLANRLAALGVGPGAVVGVALERSMDLVVALLAVLKAGGAYLPLDLVYPEERLDFMVAEAACPLVLTRPALADSFAAAGRRILALDAAEDSGASGEEDPAPRVTGDHLAYVLFTSGSTGRPKGVMVPHGALARYVDWAAAAYRASGGDAPLHTSIGFDLSITSLFVPLVAGRRVVLLGEDEGGESLVEALRRPEGFGLVKLTPAHLEMLARRLAPPEARDRVGALVIGGEALTYERLAFWRSHAPGTRLINEYGPTEAVVGCCVHEVGAGEADVGSVPIGRPVPYARLRLLDRTLREVLPGVAGELCIGGEVLARGYLGRADATALSFVPDPLAETAGARLYRTGDLARYLPDGRLQFRGRIDHQIKVRGHRIEPAEIEAALLAYPGIRDAVVLLRETPPGPLHLVAYVVAGAPAPAATELRQSLSRRLPAYMLPAAFVVLDELPLTAHGKVDRGRLPDPEGGRSAARAPFLAPRTAVEGALAAVWCRVLRLDRVGVHDNFFEIGGDSILALQIVAQAGRKGLRITPRQIFLHQTLAELAAVADTGRAVALEAGPVVGPVPLTPIQAWFFERELPAPHHFNQSVSLELRLPVPPAVWEQALARLAEHHDALRFRFERGRDGWRQTALPLDGGQAVTRIDLSALPESRRRRSLEEAAGQVQLGLDLAAGPLLRLALIDLAAGGPQRALIVIHHLVVDGVSWEILLGDLESLCLALSRGEEPELPPRTTSFKTWAERLVALASSREGELSHWLALEAMAPPRLPRDRVAGIDVEAQARTLWVGLSAEETRLLLQERLADLRCRIDEALLSALLRAFADWTGADGLLIDVEGHGREEIAEDLDVTRTVGWFTTLHPVVLDGGTTDDPLAVLRAVKERLRAVPGRGLGYGLLRYLHPSPQVRERLRRLPSAEVSFNYLGQVGGSVAQSLLWQGAAEPRGAERSALQPRPHRLSVDGAVVAGELRLGWTYSEALHDRDSVERLAHTFLGALRELIERRDAGVGEIYTPADFPDLDLTHADLNQILQELE